MKKSPANTPVKVLLVEDDHWLAELEMSVLSDAGYTVHHAPHALAAIDLVDATQPDVIILDVLLGGSTAFALLHELQSYTDTRKVPVVLCTNLAEQFTAQQLEGYGVRRIIDKTTMLPSDVVAAVKAVL